MRSNALVLAVVCSLLAVGLGTIGSTPVFALESPAIQSGNVTEAEIETETETGTKNHSAIIKVYPNLPVPQNRGEYVVVTLAQPGNWTLTDGVSTVSLPRNHTGPIAVTRDPHLTQNITRYPVYETASRFRLSQDGETLTLKRDGKMVDKIAYDRATEGDRWHRNASQQWIPEGLTLRETVNTGPATVETFVLPDTPAQPIEPITTATDRVHIGAYTFESWTAAKALVEAHDRGANVSVLVDGNPVGGVSEQQKSVLDTLVAEGVTVHVLGGDRSRFRFHHPKYAIADENAVVLTENWKPAGTGGKESRGWGVRIENNRTANELYTVYRHDTGWKDTVSWETYRTQIDTTEQPVAAGEFETAHRAKKHTADQVSVLTAPGNAEDAVVKMLRSAEDEVLIMQPQLASPQQRMVRAAVAAAKRGVDVKILLSDAWYSNEENSAIAAHMNRQADAGNYPLAVRVDEPNGRYGKIHAKGLVVDNTTIVGSLNWNDNSARENREVAVQIESAEVATYYRSVFAADWQTDKHDERTVRYVEGGVLILIGLIAIGTIAYAHRSIIFAE